MPFNVLFHDVADADLGPLLARAADLGYATPTVSLVAAVADHRVDGAGNDLVADWRLVDHREGQVYRWPKRLEHYDSYEVYRGETQREGTVFISLGRAVRRGKWAMDRRYVVSFLSKRAPQTPLAEFLATDDCAETGELIAVIRGSDGGRKMYGPTEHLPPAYAGFRIATFRDRVQVKGSLNKLAVITADNDTDTILNHALIQARRRGNL